jgi:UDP-3-O-[3-hydroxymyristoyl] glucosamine N-acyltransferase
VTVRAKQRWRLADLASAVGGRVRGDPERILAGVATLEAAGPEDLSFLTNPRYRQAAAASKAGAILVGPGADLAGHDLLEAPEPYLALAELLERMHAEAAAAPGISPDARVGADVRVGRDVAIGPFAVIGDRCAIGDEVTVGAGCILGEGCEIGERSRLHPRVVLYANTSIGARCLVHAGVVLGGDGFGFATSRGVHRKVPQIGRVVVEDDVEIGSNTTIDRGAIGETRIGAGTKIDNLVMIAHGVVIGAGGLLAAQTGIAGSTTVGHHATFAGQAGVAGHLKLGDRAIVAGKSAVFADVEAGGFVAGIPAVDHRVWKKSQALVRDLPELLGRIRDLERRLAELEAQGEGKA